MSCADKSEGLDLEKLIVKKRFHFLDGLTGLFLPAQMQPHQQGMITNKSSDSAFSMIISEISALKGESESKVLIVIDQLDLLLAAGGDGINAVKMGEMIMRLREVNPTLLYNIAG